MPQIEIKANLDNMGEFKRNRATVDIREVKIGPQLPGESDLFYRQVSDLASSLLNLEPNFGSGRMIQAILADQIIVNNPGELPRRITSMQSSYLPAGPIDKSTNFETSILIEPAKRIP